MKTLDARMQTVVDPCVADSVIVDVAYRLTCEERAPVETEIPRMIVESFADHGIKVVAEDFSFALTATAIGFADEPMPEMLDHWRSQHRAGQNMRSVFDDLMATPKRGRR